MQMQYDAWYICALPEEIGRELRRRVILGHPVLLYRTEAGQPVALADRCPHRFAPLSRGKLCKDSVQCGYHGLVFGTDGSCVHNPHGDVIAPHNRVRSFPIVERHGLVWLWAGNPELASPASIPDLSYMTAAGFRTSHKYFPADYRYDILIDNLLDLSHIDYLHVGSFASGACERSETKVIEEGNEVLIIYTQFNTPAPPGTAGVAEGEMINQRFYIRWHPGQVVTFEAARVPLGEDIDTWPRFRFSHVATPGAEGKTQYFLSFTRNFDLDNPALDAHFVEDGARVIQNEDGPMLEAVDREMQGQELLDLAPVILPTDTGALRVRRVMKRLIAAEADRAMAPKNAPAKAVTG